MITRQNLVSKVIAVLVISLIPSVGVISEAQAACTGSYQIGFQGPLTGPEAYFGTTQLKAVKFALEKFKSANPNVAISGTVATYDDQGDPAIAAQIAPTAAANQCLLALVGPSYSVAARVSFPHYLSASLPIITPSASNLILSSYGSTIFHRNVVLEKQIYLDMLSDIGAVAPETTIGYFYGAGSVDPNVLYGLAGVSGIQISSYEETNNDIEATKSAVLDAYNRGIRYFVYDFSDNETHATNFATYLKTLSGTQLIFGPYYDLKTVASNKSFIQGAWAYSMSYPLDLINPTLGAQFKASQNEDASFYSGQTFDAAMFFLEGIKAGANTRSTLNTFIGSKVFNGLTGPQSFGSNGDLEGKKSFKFVFGNNTLSVANSLEVGANGDLTVTNKPEAFNNFQFKVTEWDASSIASTAFFHFPKYNKIVTSTSDVLNLNIPNGTTTFDIISSTDPQGPVSRKSTFQVKASNGLVTEVKDITIPSSPTTVNIVGDTYVFKFKSFNFIATILGDNEYTGSTAIIYEKTNSGDVGKYKIPVRNFNKIYALLDPSKNYRIDFYPGNLNPKYDLTSWDNISFAGASTKTFSGTPDSSNILGKISPYPSSGGYLKVFTKDANGAFTVLAKTKSVSGDGTYGFYLAPGTKYKISAVPKSTSLGTNTSIEYTAPSAGSIVLPDIGFLGANVSGTVSGAGGVVPGAYFYVYSAPGVEAYNGTTDKDGKFNIFLEAGSYKISLDAGNLTYLYNWKEIDCVVASVSTPVVCNASLDSKKISGLIKINGSTLKVIETNARKILSGDNDNWDVYGDESGKYGIDGSLGTYQISIGGTVGVAPNVQAIGGVTPATCEMTNTPKICNFDLSTNFNFQITDYSGAALWNKSMAIIYATYSPNTKGYTDQLFQNNLGDKYSKISFPDGTFYLAVGNNGYRSRNLSTVSYFKVTVSNGAVTEVKNNQTNELVNAAQGIYTLKTKKPNFVVKAIDGDQELNNPTFYIGPLDQPDYSEEIWIDTNESGFDFLLADGSYKLTLAPKSDLPATKVEGKYTVTVINGVVTTVKKTSDNSNVLPINGVFPIKFGQPNLSGVVTRGGTPIVAQIQVLTLNTFKNFFINVAGRNTSSDGKFAFNLDPGTYRFNIGTSEPGYENMIWVQSDQSCEVLINHETKCDLSIPVKSIEFAMKNSNGVIQKFTYASVSSRSSVGSNSRVYNYPNYQSGIYKFPLFDGTYDVEVFQSDGVAQDSKKFEIIIENQYIKSFKESLTNQLITPNGGIYQLSFFTPNLTGSFKNPQGNSLSFTSGQRQFINVELQYFENGAWAGKNYYYYNTSNFELRVNTPGKYRLRVMPYGFDGMSTSYSAPFYVDSSMQVSLSEASGFATQLSNFTINLKAPNLKLKLVNPIDNLPLTSGWVWIYKKNGPKEDFFEDVYLSASSLGLVNKFLPEGEYRLILQPNENPSLDRNEFSITVNSSEVVSITESDVAVNATLGTFTLKPLSANIFGTTVNSDGNVIGSVSDSSIGVGVQKLDSNGYWSWVNKGTTVNQDGYFGFRLIDIGKYRLVFSPYRSLVAAQTYSPEFEITESNKVGFTKNFGKISLNAPNLKISVVSSDTSTALTNTFVSIYGTDLESKKSGWYLGVDTGNTGVATTYIDRPGTFIAEIFPSTALSQEGYVAKRYTITAVANSNGVVTASVDSGQGAVLSNGVNRLKLGSSNLRGTVTSPNGTTVIPQALVIPVKIVDGKEIEMYELSSNSDQNGRWNISLPQGTYKIKARAPWGSIDYGSSQLIGTITVDSQTAVTAVPIGKVALAFTIALRTPTWSGVIKAPTGDTVISNAQICLNYMYTQNAWRQDCAGSNQSGQFALSVPDGVTLDENTELFMYEYENKYPQLRLKGKSAIEAALGVSGTGLTVRFPSSNLRITATFGGNPVSDVQLYADRSGEWIGGVRTNSSGIAGFYSANISSGFTVRADVWNEATALNSTYVSTVKTFTSSDMTSGTSNSIFSGSLALNAPNILGIVREPGTNGNLGVVNNSSYINVYEVSTGEWVTWARTAADGTFALFLKGECCTSREYTIVLEPGSKDGVTKYVRKDFKVLVSTSNVATIYDKRTGLAISSETISGKSVLSLLVGEANVSGTVVNPSGVTVPNVDVTVNGKCGISGCWYWSDQNGSFKFNLEDQSVILQAGNYSYNSEFARSAECPITIANGVITSTGGCVQSNGTVRLALRSPNLSFTLKNGSSLVNNAYVNVGIGNWWTFAQVQQNGKISIFIDTEQIALRNPGMNGQTLDVRIYIDPYGDSAAVRWNCIAGDAKPVCNQLSNYTVGQNWSDKILGDVQVVTSNTKVRIIRPDNNAAISKGGYMELYRIDHGYDEWVGWSQTDSQGYTSFYLDETSYSGAKFKLRVYPNWELRSIFSSKTWDNSGSGYSLTQINNASFALGTPNLKLTVLSPSGNTPNKWGFTRVEKVDSSNNPISWVDGNSLDENGSVSFLLPANSRYRITADPKSGGSGTMTQCLVDVDSATVVSLVAGQCVGGSISNNLNLTLTLARGNIIGIVVGSDGVTPIVGAIVYANIVGATNEDKAVIGCTLADGSYGINLAPGLQWQLKIFPANGVSDQIKYANKTDLPAITPPNYGSTTINVQLTRSS